MFKIISKSLWLLLFSVVICCVIYPLVLWGIGQTVFPFQANGSIVNGPDGKPVGSLLIAQPFAKPEHFTPRGSAISTPYDATSSTSSALAVSNYVLRDRVANAIGPVATYKSGPKKDQNVAPEIEEWFHKDKFQGQPSIVAQWADLHNSVAQGWVGTTFDAKNPTPPQQYVLDWEKTHAAVVEKFKKDNPDNSDPSPSDLAMVFFESFSKDHPGKFPSSVTHMSADGKTSTTAIEPVDKGSDTQTDIQAHFFDMWLTDNPTVELNDVPGDWATTSGSGLDPHITLANAMFQLDGVAGAWAKDTKADVKKVHDEIEALLKEKSFAPLGGAWGEPMVNVLEINLALDTKYGATTAGKP
jgi:K+-transporting ATPase ATPase C chain